MAMPIATPDGSAVDKNRHRTNRDQPPSQSTSLAAEPQEPAGRAIVTTLSATRIPGVPRWAEKYFVKEQLNDNNDQGNDQNKGWCLPSGFLYRGVRKDGAAYVCTGLEYLPEDYKTLSVINHRGRIDVDMTRVLYQEHHWLMARGGFSDGQKAAILCDTAYGPPLKYDENKEEQPSTALSVPDNKRALIGTESTVPDCHESAAIVTYTVDPPHGYVVPSAQPTVYRIVRPGDKRPLKANGRHTPSSLARTSHGCHTIINPELHYMNGHGKWRRMLLSDVPKHWDLDARQLARTRVREPQPFVPRKLKADADIVNVKSGGVMPRPKNMNKYSLKTEISRAGRLYFESVTRPFHGDAIGAVCPDTRVDAAHAAHLANGVAPVTDKLKIYLTADDFNAPGLCDIRMGSDGVRTASKWTDPDSGVQLVGAFIWFQPRCHAMGGLDMIEYTAGLADTTEPNKWQKYPYIGYAGQPAYGFDNPEPGDINCQVISDAYTVRFCGIFEQTGTVEWPEEGADGLDKFRGAKEIVDRVHAKHPRKRSYGFYTGVRGLMGIHAPFHPPNNLLFQHGFESNIVLTEMGHEATVTELTRRQLGVRPKDEVGPQDERSYITKARNGKSKQQSHGVEEKEHTIKFDDMSSYPDEGGDDTASLNASGHKQEKGSECGDAMGVMLISNGIELSSGLFAARRYESEARRDYADTPGSLTENTVSCHTAVVRMSRFEAISENSERLRLLSAGLKVHSAQSIHADVEDVKITAGGVKLTTLMKIFKWSQGGPGDYPRPCSPLGLHLVPTLITTPRKSSGHLGVEVRYSPDQDPRQAEEVLTAVPVDSYNTTGVPIRRLSLHPPAFKLVDVGMTSDPLKANIRPYSDILTALPGLDTSEHDLISVGSNVPCVHVIFPVDTTDPRNAELERQSKPLKRRIDTLVIDAIAHSQVGLSGCSPFHPVRRTYDKSISYVRPHLGNEKLFPVVSIPGRRRPFDDVVNHASVVMDNRNPQAVKIMALLDRL